MQTIWQDVRFGVRMLVKHRIATIVCVIALGLGIGANTAMFSLAEAFLLHPVPFENSDRIVSLVDSRVASQDGGAGFGPHGNRTRTESSVTCLELCLLGRELGHRQHENSGS